MNINLTNLNLFTDLESNFQFNLPKNLSFIDSQPIQQDIDYLIKKL